MATIDDIISRAQQVRDETTIGANTASRVGGVMKDTADHVKVLEETPLVVPDRSITEAKTDFMSLFNGDDEYSTYYNSDVAEIYIADSAQDATISRYAFRSFNNTVIIKAFNPGNTIVWYARLSLDNVTDGVVAEIPCYQQGTSSIALGDVCAYVVIRDKASFATHTTTTDTIQPSKAHIENLVFAPAVNAYLNRYIIPDSAVTTSKIADNAVTPAKASFFTKERESKNLFDPASFVLGEYIRTDNGKTATTTVAGRGRTGYIPITEDGLYCNNLDAGGTIVGQAYYDENKQFLQGLHQKNVPIPYVEGASFVRLTLANNTDVMVNVGTTPIPYEPYSDVKRDVINPTYLPEVSPSTDPIGTDDIDDSAVTFPKIADDASMEKGVGINLPTEIVAVVGRELQIYHRSVVQAIDPYIYDIEVACSIGNNYPRYYSIVPTASGTWTLTYYVRRPNGTLVASKSTTLRVVADKTSGATFAKSILVVGASVVNSGYLQAELKRMMTTDTANTANVEQVGNIYPQGKNFSGVSFVGRKNSTIHLEETYVQNGEKVTNDVDVENVAFEATGGNQWHTYVVGRNAYRFQLTTSPSISLGAVYTVSGVDITVVEVNGTEICGTYTSGTIPASGTLTKKSGSGDATLTYTSYESESYSPFLNNGVVDFRAYADTYCNGNIDVLVWHIGTNDVFQNSQTIEEDMRTLFNAFHADFPNGKIIVSSPPIVDPRGGMGASYGSSSSYYWGNIARRYYALWELYDSLCNDVGFSSFVKFAHTGIMMDIENTYKYSIVNVNTRLGEKELRGNNGAHPAPCGCYQIADGIYNTLITL